MIKVGIATSCSDRSLAPATVARVVEEAGFETISFGEHSHIPAARETPYPGGDGQLPPGYERLLDLVVCLTCAALATESIRLATGIMQIVQRDPIQTAKAVATLDQLSNGRMLLITGSSWNLEEMRNHGVDPATRYELLEERVLAMREIWAHEEASFHGQFVDFERIWSWPKPVQDPMPVLIGGNSEGVEERARQAGTGWAPLAFPGTPERIRAYLTKAAQDGATTTVTAVGGAPLSARVLEDYAAAGAERYLYGIPIPMDEGQLADELEHVLAAQADLAGTP
jgi:probable F420-dependent oxidoreductase